MWHWRVTSVEIRPAIFTVKHIEQSSTFPGDGSNVISISLQANARVSGCTLTIQGLPSTAKPGNVSDPIIQFKTLGTGGSSDVFSVGARTSHARVVDGDIYLHVDSSCEMLPHTTFAFSF